MISSAPGWQTEELQDEWVDLDPENEKDDDENDLTYGTRSISFTVPLTAHIHTNSDYEEDGGPSANTSRAVGTFLIRDDVAHSPLLLKTPGANKKGLIKDFFTPLPLERMFEPPSPPTDSLACVKSSPPPASQPADKGDEIVQTDMPNMNSFHGRKASASCQFTFSVPKDVSSRLGVAFPQAQSTPNPPFPQRSAPATDPRLRLFQFQYDTYTRDHLSAMVDSIAINTPSGTGTTTSPTSFDQALSRVSEAVGSVTNNTYHLRSAKRVKLSPATDFYGEGAGAGATILRPKLYGKDYVGESRSLMQQIKQARDFSTISSVASAPKDSPSTSPVNLKSDDSRLSTTNRDSNHSFLTVPGNSKSIHSSSSSIGSKVNIYSSSTYRQNAAALMDQIKQDMKHHKRIFSGDSDVSHLTTHVGQHGQKDNENPRRAINSPGHRRTSSSKSNSSRHKASSRKAQPHDDSSQVLADKFSNCSLRTEVSSPSISSSQRAARQELPQPPPSTLAPPAHPSLRNNEDLNRFVSSSTASGTTLTACSAPSFIKHAGPAHLKTIVPGDVPTLPDRYGDMLFDKIMMRWIKSGTQLTMDGDQTGVSAGEMSEDPFGDIESLVDDSRGMDPNLREFTEDFDELPGGGGEMSRIEERSEVDDAEELELTSFSTDASAHVVDIMTGVDTTGFDDGDQTTDSDDDLDLTATQEEIRDFESDEEETRPPEFQGPLYRPSNHPQLVATLTVPSIDVPDLSTPSRKNPSPASLTPIIRSALKSNSATPTSALKNSHRHKYQTPLHERGHRRSVSFSDGKHEGPIQGLSSSTSGEEFSRALEALSQSSLSGSSGVVQSVRSKRIADMMHALEDEDDLIDDDSPSKTSSAGRPDELRPLASRQPVNDTPGNSKADAPRRTLSRSQTHRPSPAKRSFTRANGTFLTECSFGVARDRLVEVITDIQPFEPHWEELSSINLSNRKLESLARLKEFLPRLDSLNVNTNLLSWLSGIPTTLRTLSVACNSLTGLTSYSHLLNLENLDISHNEVESLRQLGCLRHLRELKADGNNITSIDGLEHLDGLVKLSLQSNSIPFVDFGHCRWSRLEMLNISYNQLDNVQGLSSLQSLVALNLDGNFLKDLEMKNPLPRLRILRVSANRLCHLQVAAVPNLRTLYADNNALSSLVKVDRLSKLENLSLRNQSGRGLKFLTRDVRDVKRLYLSGNPLNTSLLEEPCYNLVYLELAACRLTALPEGMARLVPNLRVLNLNYNFLEDVRLLEGLTRLQKLTIIGSRLKSTKPLIRLLQRTPDVEMLDFRMNPCTLGWYLPLLVKDVPGALQPSEGTSGGKSEKVLVPQGWQELDSKFRRDLPNEAYIGRLAYRGLIMQACPRIRMLDGVGVSEKERMKAHHLLQGILRKGKTMVSKGKMRVGGGA